MADDNTSNRGAGSDNMSEEEKERIQSQGGSASPQNFANNPDLASETGSKSHSGGGNNS
jgi:general stress protein YciG